jgi:hypothetical protein
MTKYTKEDIVQAVKNSDSLSDVLRNLGLRVAGSNLRTLKIKIKQYDIDISNFTYQKNVIKNFVDRRRVPIEVYLSNQKSIGSYVLKNKLIKQGFFQKQCSYCHLTTWLGRDIPLELHHMDGNHNNNTLENLTILCPNCHAMTEKDNIRKQTKIVETYCSCGKKICQKSTKCRSCSVLGTKQKITYPHYTTLEKMISNSTMTQIARELGISFNTLKKHMKNHKPKLAVSESD